MYFSVLIAHYQNWDYFLDCYQSLKNQTYQNFEIVLVDDFSTDGSYENLVEFASQDSRIKLFRNSENLGVGYTKNKCIEFAKGEVLGFVDPDDALEKNALELMIAAHKEHKNASSVYSVMMMCDENLNPIKRFNRAKKVRNGDELFVNITTSVAHFFTFKQIAVNKISNIDVRLRSAVDQDLYLKLYEVGNFVFLDVPLYLYRLHEKGVSQDKNKSKAKTDFKRVIRETLNRRGINQLQGKSLNNLTDDEIYDFLSSRENNFLNKLKNKFINFF